MLRRPPPLVPGSTIAIVAPASPPRNPEPYEKGLARLKDTYDVRPLWQPGAERGYLAAPDAARTDALHRAIRDPDVRAIVCVRGGYGCLRVLPRLDWAFARRNPTLLVGYSDVTALHLAFNAKADWPGLSGPVVTEWAEADDATLTSFRSLSSGRGADFTAGFEASFEPMVSGSATGPLLGGNLSVLSRLIGTRFAPDFEGPFWFSKRSPKRRTGSIACSPTSSTPASWTQWPGSSSVTFRRATWTRTSRPSP